VKFASLFTGFGGVEIGARAAGLELSWGIEKDIAIAAVANKNLGDHVQVANILDCNPHDYTTVDVLHASPPCPNFSIANHKRGEAELDIALARKAAEFIRVLRPIAFTLENVQAYRASESFALIIETLEGMGYWWEAIVLNAADFGVPQSRRRLFIRAQLGKMLRPLPPPTRPRKGWYQAIEDLIPTLPKSHFAEWQMNRLPNFVSDSFTVDSAGFPDDEGVRVPVMRQADEPVGTIVANYSRRNLNAFLVGGANTSSVQAAPGVGVSEQNEPVHCVAQNSNRWRAFVVDDQNNGTPDENSIRGLTIRQDDEPIFTISATQTKRSIRAWLETGHVVAMTPRCLARFQTFPDWYKLPDNNALACRGIGNAVPPILYQRVVESLVGD